MNPLSKMLSVAVAAFIYISAGSALHPADKLLAILWPMTMAADAIVWAWWLALRAVAVTVTACLVVIILATFYGGFWRWLHDEKHPQTIEAEPEAGT